MHHVDRIVNMIDYSGDFAGGMPGPRLDQACVMTEQEDSLKLGVIGYGAISRFLIEQLKSEPDIEIVSVFAVPAVDAGQVRAAHSIEELLRSGPDMVVECAGHEALRQCGAAVIEAGKDLLVASVGALADPALEKSLRDASKSGGRLLIPAGALGGLEALRTARAAGLQTVDYVGRKAPAAWKGTAAETLVDLAGVKCATTFLECDARTAALRFPQNANVVAALALAGVGFERTKVRLIVDPDASGNHHAYVASGEFGEISASIRSKTLPSNTKTSVLAPFSLIQTIKTRAGIAVA